MTRAVASIEPHAGERDTGAGGDFVSFLLIPSLVPAMVVLVAMGVVVLRWSERCVRENRTRRADVHPFENEMVEDRLADIIGTLFCPVCRTEFLRSAVVCEDCGVELVDESELPDAEPMIEQGVVRVARVNRSGQAHLIRDFLSANHVPSATGRSGFAGADIYVFESDALRARRLIDECLGVQCAI